MKRILLSVVFFFFFHQAFSQHILGSITDEQGRALPYASVIVKGTNKGAVANSQGKYSIVLSPGTYTLICQHVGYRSEHRTVPMKEQNIVLDFSLSVQELKMEAVVVKRGPDPAIEIMKQTIRKRDHYNRQVDSMTVDVYIKGLLKSRAVPDKFMGQKVDKKEMEKEGFDSTGKGILFLSESVTKVAYKKPDKFKYEVVSSRESGGGFGLTLPFFINFYTNNVEVFKNNLNPRGFISPIADNAFHYYKFKFEGNFFDGDKMVDRIRVTPRRKNEPLFEGFLQIVDGEWMLHSVDLLTTKDYQLDLVDSLRITQIQAPVKGNIWKTQNQVVYITANIFGFDITGNFLNVYTNYNVNPGFGRKYFDRIIMKYDTAFNKKDSIYWSNIRPVSLEPEEKRNFFFRDSLTKTERDSTYSRRNIDSLRKDRQKLKITDFTTRGVRRDFYSPKMFSTYRIEPLLLGVQYNTVEGPSAKLNQSIELRPKGGGNIFELRSDSRYGFSNHHFNSFLTFTIRPRVDNFRNRYLKFSGGKRLSQFNQENPIDELTNSIYTLFGKRNYMKVYENWFGRIQYNNILENGLALNFDAVYEDRLPVHNTTDYSFFSKEKQLLPNHPYELASIPFNRHQALVATGKLSFQPGQRYIQFPKYKMPVGSDFPTFELMYSKGIADVLGSDVDFDKWQFSVRDNMNFRMLGAMRYKFSVGGFLNNRRVEIPDFQHFSGNQTIYNTNSFRLAPYYRYSNTENLYALIHAEHHFNGLLTNKIPLFNKLKWNLVVGTNTFYVNRNNYYIEAFAGLENIFKIFRVDFIMATQADRAERNYGIRIGLGGVLGGAVQVNRR